MSAIEYCLISFPLYKYEIGLSSEICNNNTIVYMFKQVRTERNIFVNLSNFDSNIEW